MKRLTALILTVAMIFSMASLAISVSAADAPTSGTWGDNGTWTFDEGTGTLTLSGSGEMPDYDQNYWYGPESGPWYQWRYAVVSVVIEEGITRVGDWAFGNTLSSGVYRSLENVKLPSTLKSIGEGAFANAKLTSVSLPNGLLTLERAAFYRCPITQISLPSTLKTIGGEVFTSLTSVHIPASVEEIGDSAFEAYDGTKPKSVSIDAGNKYYIVEDNVLYNKDKTEIVLYADGAETYTIPETVKAADLAGFWFCEKLRTLIVPAQVNLYCGYMPGDSMGTVNYTFSIYFYGDAPTYLDTYVMCCSENGESGYAALDIYYVEGRSGWDQCINNYYQDINSFHTWTPDGVVDTPVIDDYTIENPITSPSSKFTDVDYDAWYREYVDYVLTNGLMTGVSDDTFAPDVTTNRGMLVTVLYRLEGEPSVDAGSDFYDVNESDYCANAVAWAAENGIVTGYGGGVFAPADAVTRQQVATILYRYAQYKDYDVSASADLSGYTDAGEIQDWALEAMRWANAEGLITGTTSTTLQPGGDATRAQTAALLMRFVENIAGK